MLHPVSGDILLTRSQVIAHGVAPDDPMDRGLALTLRERYPALHRDFHHWCNQHHPAPGSVWLWGGGGRRIANLLTQDRSHEHGARPGSASEKNVRETLRALARLIGDENFKSLALPRLATGVGGLPWTTVWPIIEERLGNLSLPIYVYAEYHAGRQADEPIG